jgi:hypothetical protein
MSTNGTPPMLPADWLTILDTIHSRLDESLATADRAIAGFSTRSGESAAAGHRAQMQDLATRTAPATNAQAIADDTDLAIAVSEDVLRERLGRAESLRQRLAAWTARAIG